MKGFGACTLLGPEGPDADFRVRDRTSGPLVVSLVGGGEGYRPYFENYTVDASILQPVLAGCAR